MEDIIKSLDKLSGQISQAKTNIAVLESNSENLTARLKKEFSLNSVQEAEKKLALLKKENVALQAKIEKKFEDLQSGYEW